MIRSAILWSVLAGVAAAPALLGEELPENRWVKLREDPVGARRMSSIQYASGAGAFFLWGYMNADTELLQEHPLIRVPEYDMVSLNLRDRRWTNHLPREWEKLWSRELPLAYVPRTYAGVTTGSERTVMRSKTDEPEAAPRPDLNIVFDQVAYRPVNNTLYYFTGGLTAAYDIERRRWTDLEPQNSPPPVLGGSLVWDSVNDELVLFGGGHVAEQAGSALRGYTGTWVYSLESGDWRELAVPTVPPPRMSTRMVRDEKNQLLVVFGGDGQTHYLADTWLFDMKSRSWRKSRATEGPEARAGHFTVWDPRTGYVIIGGGYNRKDLTDMWAYDPGRDQWRKVSGETPTGFHLSGDIAPESRTIVLVTSNRSPGDQMTCNVLFPVRTTYGYRIGEALSIESGYAARAERDMPKRPPEENVGIEPNPERRAAQAKRLSGMPENRWVLLKDPGRQAPARTWGSATFDPDRDRILYWGGGHCGYGGSDVDVYAVSEHTWIGDAAPDFPERAWNSGARLAGVTFTGRPFTDHGRKVYSYDSGGKRMINVSPIRLTSGYEPAGLQGFPEMAEMAADAVASTPSSYRKGVTWSYDPDAREWAVLGPAPPGVDTLTDTPHGVMGVHVNWRGRLNDAGYQWPWRPRYPAEDNAVYLLRGKRWERVDRGGPSPQNLYEQTSLAYDSRRDRLLLHGGGQRRDELWALDRKRGRWAKLSPSVLTSPGSPPPICLRESVYIPSQDVLLTYGQSTEGGPGELWAYTAVDNAWRRVEIRATEGGELLRNAGQNKGMVYDARRDLVYLVAGGRGDNGLAAVFALRYRHAGFVQ